MSPKKTPFKKSISCLEIYQDHLLRGEKSPSCDENCLQHTVEKIRELIKRPQMRGHGALEELIIIDIIQRLGVDHYFKSEIHTALKRQYAKANSWEENGGFDDDLYETALRFRLLRQQGYKYNVSPDIFKKFMNDEGNFKVELGKDVKGLLSLFEACQLSIKGEDIMDEAAEFSEKLLEVSLFDIEQPMASIIANTLKNPYHKSFAMRFLAKSCVSLDEFRFDFIDNEDWKIHLLKLQEIDFEMAQMSWRTELVQVSRWREELNLAKKLEFARIWPIRWYMWSIGILPGPNMAEERIELAKAISFIYIIDDVFDKIGTLDELLLFTEVLNRWEYGDTDLLPEYMKVCVKALFDYTNDFSLKIYKKHGWNPKNSLIKTWVDLCDSYLVEAKWFTSKALPSANDYLKNGIVSSGVHVVLMHTFFLLGEGVNKTTVEEINCLHPIITSTATLLRLWNDLAADKDSNDARKEGSYIDCYMNEHKECSVRSARLHVDQLIKDAWKFLNKEYMSPTSPFSATFLAACLNCARMASIIYSRDDQDHRQSLKKLFNRLLNDCPT